MLKFILTMVSCIVLNAQGHAEGDHMQNYTIVNKPSQMIVGIECKTSNKPDAGPIDIPKQWEKFFTEDIINKIPNKSSNDIIALYCDYEGDFTKPYYFVIGCQTTSIDEIPEGMVAKVLPASKYAVFKAAGDFPKSLIDTWGVIWQTQLNRTYTGDYEEYGEKFNKDPKEVDVFIAID